VSSATNLESVGGNIIPSANSVYDIGTAGARWRDIYLSGNTIDLGGTEISTGQAGNIRFANASNNQLRGITVSEIALDTGGNLVTLQGGVGGLVTVVAGNVVTSGSTVLERHYNYPGTLLVNNGSLRWYVQSASMITRIKATVSTAPTGAAINLRINRNGSSVATINIAANATNSSINTNISLNDGDYITVDILAVGNAPNTGSDLVVSFLYSRT